MAQQPALLTLQEVANKLRVSYKTVVKLREANLLPAIKIGAGKRSHWRVTRRALQDFLETQIRN